MRAQSRQALALFCKVMNKWYCKHTPCVPLSFPTCKKYKGVTIALSMSAARRRELADEDEFFESHPTQYHHPYTVHQPYMESLLEHILTREDERPPSNHSLCEEFRGRMRRWDHRVHLARVRTQLVDDTLVLGLFTGDSSLNCRLSTKKTWHQCRAAHEFKARCMPDGAHFTPQVRDMLVDLSHRGQTVLTSQQIDRLQRFLASCLAHRDATP